MSEGFWEDTPEKTENELLREAILSVASTAEQQNKNVNTMSSSITVLARAVKERPTYRQATVTLVVLAIMFVGVLYLGISNHQVLQRVEDVAGTIEDCTNPEGACAQRSLSDTNRVISRLVFLIDCSFQERIYNTITGLGLVAQPISDACLAED